MTGVDGSGSEQSGSAAGPRVSTTEPVEPQPADQAWAQAGYPMPPYQLPEPDRLTRFVDRVQARMPRWAAPVAALGTMAVAVGYTLYSDPTHSSPDAAPSCVLKLLTGLDCPGCGGTRAFWYLLHADLPAAARHHLLFVFAVPFLLYLYLAWAGRQVFGWKLPQLRVTPVMIGVFLAAWGVFTVLRNLPWAPFDYLYV